MTTHQAGTVLKDALDYEAHEVRAGAQALGRLGGLARAKRLTAMVFRGCVAIADRANPKAKRPSEGCN